jgi:hypothetical protein
MTDSSQIATDSEFSIIKLKNSLQELAERAENSLDANSLLSEATSLFKDFFTNISDPEFVPELLITGDTPKSSIYNDNLKRMYNDISRFYTELTNLSNANLKTFNFSQVVISEVKKRAAGLASLVLDLNILSNFNKGDVIVAGDDFINLDKVDTGAALGSAPAELISNGAGLSLARDSTNNLSTDPRTKIEIFPVAPSKGESNSSEVNIAPTPGNFNRFYEGSYYGFLGQARPEGGRFNIQFILDPSKLKATTDAGAGEKNTQGIFLEYGASEEDKQQARNKMLDNNPDTFWECEYLIRLKNPLIEDVVESLVITDETPTAENQPNSDSGGLRLSEPDGESGGDLSNPDAPSAAAFQVDVAELNSKALTEDIVDLDIDVIITLPEEQNVNFIAINPVVFSQKAFLEVMDIATINNSESEFTTVDNWDSIRFPKTITPEANEFLTDSQLSASLSPNRYSYLGQGIYPFPLRVASKIKMRLRMSQPSSQVYERTYALLKNNVDVKTTTTTTTTKGYLRF